MSAGTSGFIHPGKDYVNYFSPNLSAQSVTLKTVTDRASQWA